MKLKAGIFDPYLDTLGGGERYCLTVAEILAKNHYDVDLFWSGNPHVLTTAANRFDINLNHINLVPNIFSDNTKHLELSDDNQILKNFATGSQLVSRGLIHKLASFVKKIQVTSQYDLIFFLSDGSLPFLFAKHNFLHVQVPFKHPKTKLRLLDSVKNRFISQIICNSNFTKSFSDVIFNRQCCVLYPPVDISKFKSNSKKQNIILSVGRFDNILNCKKQDILIEAFISLTKKHHLQNWKLVLAGGSLEDPQNNHYLLLLKEKAKNYPIEIVVNPSFSELVNLYSVSKIYWHAAGHGVNENQHPENTEHFGITTVEAQASGIVPLVVSKGGLKETVQDGINGYLWSTTNDLIAKTYSLIQNPKLLDQLSNQCLKDAHRFSLDVFEKELIRLINS